VILTSRNKCPNLRNSPGRSPTNGNYKDQVTKSNDIFLCAKKSDKLKCENLVVSQGSVTGENNLVVEIVKANSPVLHVEKKVTSPPIANLEALMDLPTFPCQFFHLNFE
jgi:hypothetical protein